VSGNRAESKPSREKVMSRIARMGVVRRSPRHSLFKCSILLTKFRHGKKIARSADSGRQDSGAQGRVLPVSLM